MSRFENTKIPITKKLFIFISDLIRKIFGGDRIKRLSQIMIKISKNIYMKKRKKLQF